MKRFGLIVVDMQNDFVNKEGKLPVPNAEELVKPINQLINLAIKGKHFVVFTQDWHPLGHISFKQFGEHCVANSSGAQLHKDLNLALGRSVTLRKGINLREDMFSAFGATDGVFELEHFLFDQGVTDLIVVGVALEFCVRATVLDALTKSYNTYMVKDCVKAISSSGYKETPKELEEAGAKIVTLKEALKLLKVSKKQVQNV